MIELTIKKHLEAGLGVAVFLEHEDKMPASFVLFEKTGGGLKNGVHKATFAFQSYGRTLYEAARLNEAVKEAVLGLVTCDEIGGVRLNSDYNFTDTTTKAYRYQAVFDITY